MKKHILLSSLFVCSALLLSACECSSAITEEKSSITTAEGENALSSVKY